jgi:hypothetical protein
MCANSHKLVADVFRFLPMMYIVTKKHKLLNKFDMVNILRSASSMEVIKILVINYSHEPMCLKLIRGLFGVN